jgi:hypothetical protein
VSNAGTCWDSLQGRRTGRHCPSRGSGSVGLDGVTTVRGTRESLVQGDAAIRSLEMAYGSGMRG